MQAKQENQKTLQNINYKELLAAMFFKVLSQFS